MENQLKLCRLCYISVDKYIKAKSATLFYLPHRNSKFPISPTECAKAAQSLNPDSRGLFFQLVESEEKYLPETQSNAINHVRQLAAPLMSRHRIGVSKKATPSTALFRLCSNPPPPIRCQKYLCLLHYIIHLYF